MAEVKICTKCHLEKPLIEFSKNGEKRRADCKLCNNFRSRRWYDQNSEKKLQENREWKLANPDKIKEYTLKHNGSPRQKQACKNWRINNLEYARQISRTYYSNHRAERSEYNRKHKKENPHIYNAQKALRRALQLNATPKWSDLKEIRMIYKEAKDISKQTGVVHHVDHIIPLNGKIVSGLHVPNNLQIITAIDNLKKSNKYA